MTSRTIRGMEAICIILALPAVLSWMPKVAPSCAGGEKSPANPGLAHGWRTAAPRDEIAPKFSFDPNGGPKKNGALIITADEREGLQGWFAKSFEVAGGKYYHFHAVRQTEHVAVPRRSVLARIVWQDDRGKPVPADPPPGAGVGNIPLAEPEHPGDGEMSADGWTPVTGVYRAPSKATHAVIELHMQWAPSGMVRWGPCRSRKWQSRRCAACDLRLFISGRRAANRRSTTAECTSHSSPKRPSRKPI